MNLELLDAYSVNTNMHRAPLISGGYCTPAEYLCEYAARVCYASEDKTGSDPSFLPKKIVQTGHHDVIEHFRFIMRVKARMEVDLFKILNVPGVYTFEECVDTFTVSFSLRHILIWGKMLGENHKWTQRMKEITYSYAPHLFNVLAEPVTNNVLINPPMTDNVTLIGHQPSIGEGDTGAATFHVTSVSRVFSHQIVRHRLFSFSQASLRYINGTGFHKIYPTSIIDSDKAGLLMAQYDMSEEAYKEMVRDDIRKEDARFVLPLGTVTRMVITMPYAGLRHFLSLRLQKAAQWEIRGFAEDVLQLVKEVDPYFNYA